MLTNWQSIPMSALMTGESIKNDVMFDPGHFVLFLIFFFGAFSS